MSKYFLNGVCRHELVPMPMVQTFAFLNGVCRHEPKDIVDWIRSYGGRLVDVARIAGCAHSTLSLIKSGTRHSFTLDMYNKINTARMSLEGVTKHDAINQERRDKEQSQ